MTGRDWIDRHAIDMVTPRARMRPKRAVTRLIVVHRLDLSYVDGAPADVLEHAPWFFGEHPEGVGVVTVRNFYSGDWQGMVRRWKREGIPRDLHAQASSAYHLGIGRDGRLAQYLPLDAVGAHARGRLTIDDVRRSVNGVSIAIVLCGDGRKEAPTEAQAARLRETLRELLFEHEHARALTHTESNEEHGITSEKECPGALAQPVVDAARRWGAGAAQHLRTPNRW